MNSIFVNILPGSMRIAQCHDGRLFALAWENSLQANQQGTVYLGRVEQVLPGIDSAFLKIGTGESAFLNRSGLPPALKLGKKTKLSDVLRPNTPLWVQVQKPALEGKQSQVTGRPRFVGFFLIFLPLENGLHFSKKFNGDRETIREMAVLKGQKGGWIVRSGAGEAPPEWIAREAAILEALAEETLGVPEGECRAIWQPQPLQQWLVDHAFPLPDSLFIDDRSTFEKTRDWLVDRHPGLLSRLHFHDSRRPLFEVYKIQSQIEKVLAGHIWLPSGGSIVFRQTTALVAIDVNSGKHIKAKGGVRAPLRTNLEALDEIAKQLRLRNLAGVVVIDFIDMKHGADSNTLAKACRHAFAEDEAAVDQLPLNRFGLLCLTRERRGHDLNRQTHRICPRCKGEGWVPHFACLAIAVQTELIRDGRDWQGERVLIQCHREFAAFLKNNKQKLFTALENALELEVQIEIDPKCQRDAYSLQLADECED